MFLNQGCLIWVIFRKSLLFLGCFVFFGLFPAFLGAQEKADTAVSPGQAAARAIKVVQRATGVFVYQYAETMEPIRPLQDFVSVRKVIDPGVIKELKRLLSENADYKPQFTARCLPVWDYGLEFREKEQSSLFLFSFRCGTLKLVAETLFKDFGPQRTAFYSIFKYEINEKTSVVVKKQAIAP